MSSPVVLIADDDQEVAALLRAYLRPLKCETLMARDGEEALGIAQSRLPDVVLLDVMMPKRSGWEVCQALRAIQRTSHIGVILITGRGDVKDRLTGLQVGADDYLVKPFDRNQVVHRVKAVLNRVAAPRDERSDAGRSALDAMLLDKITALPTLPIVLDGLKELLIEHGEMGIVNFDVEQLEPIESEYGWAFFDELLCHVGQTISAEASERFRNATVTCHRTGGSSFYVFHETKGQDLSAENQSEAIASDIRLRLIEAVRRRFPQVRFEQLGFFVGTTRIDYRPQIRLERQIYAGMRTAADAARNAEQQIKKQMTRELRDIIRRRRLTTLFQPIVRAVDGTVFGYEILTRGPSNSTFRNSDMLFSFARETKLAWALEAIALESALRRLKQIDLLDRKFLLNLEAEMFSETELHMHEVVAFFAEHRGHFVLELTERAAIEDYVTFRGLLDDFRGKGIEVAIDDAGSGYASLEAIASLAPDFLKITKGLVSTLAAEPIKQDLVRMLVELAGKINAKTIAEGIETREEYQTCRDLGIDLLQGYYFARPQEDLRKADAEVSAVRRAISSGPRFGDRSSPSAADAPSPPPR